MPEEGLESISIFQRLMARSGPTISGRNYNEPLHPPSFVTMHTSVNDAKPLPDEEVKRISMILSSDKRSNEFAKFVSKVMKKTVFLQKLKETSAQEDLVKSKDPEYQKETELRRQFEASIKVPDLLQNYVMRERVRNKHDLDGPAKARVVVAEFLNPKAPLEQESDRKRREAQELESARKKKLAMEHAAAKAKKAAQKSAQARKPAPKPTLIQQTGQTRKLATIAPTTTATVPETAVARRNTVIKQQTTQQPPQRRSSAVDRFARSGTNTSRRASVSAVPTPEILAKENALRQYYALYTTVYNPIDARNAKSANGGAQRRKLYGVAAVNKKKRAMGLVGSLGAVGTKRDAELEEVAKIMEAFEHHHQDISRNVVEHAILTPEDVILPAIPFTRLRRKARQSRKKPKKKFGVLAKDGEGKLVNGNDQGGESSRIGTGDSSAQSSAGNRTTTASSKSTRSASSSEYWDESEVSTDYETTTDYSTSSSYFYSDDEDIDTDDEEGGKKKSRKLKQHDERVSISTDIHQLQSTVDMVQRASKEVISISTDIHQRQSTVDMVQRASKEVLKSLKSISEVAPLASKTASKKSLASIKASNPTLKSSKSLLSTKSLSSQPPAAAAVQKQQKEVEKLQSLPEAVVPKSETTQVQSQVHAQVKPKVEQQSKPQPQSQLPKQQSTKSDPLEKRPEKPKEKKLRRVDDSDASGNVSDNDSDSSNSHQRRRRHHRRERHASKSHKERKSEKVKEAEKAKLEAEKEADSHRDHFKSLHHPRANETATISTKHHLKQSKDTQQITWFPSCERPKSSGDVPPGRFVDVSTAFPMTRSRTVGQDSKDVKERYEPALLSRSRKLTAPVTDNATTYTNVLKLAPKPPVWPVQATTSQTTTSQQGSYLQTVSPRYRAGFLG